MPTRRVEGPADRRGEVGGGPALNRGTESAMKAPPIDEAKIKCAAAEFATDWCPQ